MGWSFKVARVAGTDVKIHVTFLLLLAWIGLMYYQRGGTEAAVQGVLFILLIFVCVVLHEFGHATAARYFGIETPDITLLPIGGVARIQRMPDQPWQELVVAIAGPLVNVVIALVLIGALGGRLDVSHLDKIDDPGVALMVKLAAVNIWLVLFNLIPAFPMDGGRVLRSLLAMGTSYGRATQTAAMIGQGIAFLFGFAGLFINPLLIFIALFVYLGASHEAHMAQMKDISANMHVAEAMVTNVVCLKKEDTLEEAIDALLRTAQHEFPVVDENQQALGVLTRNAMISALKKSGPSTPVVDVMDRDLPTVRADDNFQAAFRQMQERGCPALPVLDRHGRLVGLVTPENVGELMMVKSVLPDGGKPAWRLAR